MKFESQSLQYFYLNLRYGGMRDSIHGLNQSTGLYPIA